MWNPAGVIGAPALPPNQATPSTQAMMRSLGEAPSVRKSRVLPNDTAIGDWDFKMGGDIATYGQFTRSDSLIDTVGNRGGSYVMPSSVKVSASTSAAHIDAGSITS